MSPEPEVPADYLNQKLKGYNIFNGLDGRLQKINHKVWTDIKNDLDLKMQAKSIYHYVYNDTYNVKTELMKHHGIISVQEPPKKKLKREDSDFSEEDVRNPQDLVIEDFNFSIPNYKMFSCSDSVISKIKGWGDNIQEKIFLHKGISCAHNFRNSYFTKDGGFHFSGICNACGSQVKRLIKDIHQHDLMAELRAPIANFDHGSHKRKLANERRTETKKFLVHTTAANRREEMLENMPGSSPFLNNTFVIRKARQEAVDEHVGYNKLKNLPVYEPIFIEECGVRKLQKVMCNTIYFLKNQIDLWNLLRQLRLPLSLDASGGLMINEDDEGSALFTYYMVVGFEKKIIPLFQAGLTVQTVPALTEALDLWLENVALVPHEITTDGSVMLQNAICLSFNKMTYSAYLLCLFLILIGKYQNLPPCYYRHDIAHLLHSVKNWKCFTSADEEVRQFYLRAVGYLSQCTSKEEFQDVLIATIIVASSNIAKPGSEAFKKIKVLNKLFQTFKYNKEEFNIITNNKSGTQRKCKKQDVMQDDVKEEKEVNDLTMYIDSLFETALSASTSTDEATVHENFLYCPNLIKNFKNLCYSFLAWTNVMKSTYNSPNETASSARSEAFFKYKKQAVPYPLKVVKYIKKDVKTINALVNFGFSRANNMGLKQETEKSRVSKLDFD